MGKRVTVLFVSGLAMWLVVELALRVCVAHSQRLQVWLTAEPLLRKDPLLGHRPSPAYPEHDTKGFRNAFVPAQVDVVALGDSQTYGAGVSRDQAWPQQLERLSRRTTYNMAFGGYGPAHSLLLFEEAMALRPRLIIEAFYSGNDLFDSYWLVYHRRPLAVLRTEDQSVLEMLRRAERTEPFEGWGKPIETRNFLATHSTAYRLLGLIEHRFLDLGDVGSSETLQALYWGATKSVFRWRASRYQIVEAGDVKTVLAPSYRLVALNLDDPRIAEGLRVALESIERMRQRAQAAHITYVVLLLPTKESVYQDVIPRQDRSTVYAELLKQETILWQRMKTFLEEREIPVIDALPALRTSVRCQVSPYFVTRDGHPDATGQRIIAELMASRLDQQDRLEQQ